MADSQTGRDQPNKVQLLREQMTQMQAIIKQMFREQSVNSEKAKQR